MGAGTSRLIGDINTVRHVYYKVPGFWPFFMPTN